MSQEAAPEVPVEVPKTIPPPLPEVTDTSSSSTHVPVVAEPTPVITPAVETTPTDTIVKPIETIEQPKPIEPVTTAPLTPVQNDTKPPEAPKPQPPVSNVPSASPSKPVAKAAIASTGLLSNLYLPSKYKVIFLGDMSTGKTSIIARFMYNSFDRQEHTIGIDFLSKTIALEDRSVRLQLWDTAGQERYRALISAYIRESQAAVLVYDITHRPSFDSLDKWAEDVRKECGDDVLLLIVGNKSDLSSKRTVTKEEGEAKAQQLRTLFIETSAKTGAQVQQLFNKLAAALPAGNASAPLSAPGPAPPPPSTTTAGFGLTYPATTTGSASRCSC